VYCLGVQRAAQKTLTHEQFKEQLEAPLENFLVNRQFRSKLHTIYSVSTNKRALCSFDDKRFLCSDGITTVAHGHHNLPTVIEEVEQPEGVDDDVRPHFSLLAPVEPVMNPHDGRIRSLRKYRTLVEHFFNHARGIVRPRPQHPRLTFEQVDEILAIVNKGLFERTSEPKLRKRVSDLLCEYIEGDENREREEAAREAAHQETLNHMTREELLAYIDIM
jgi:hypothetical protein